MAGHELRQLAEQVVVQAMVVRVMFPDAEAMRSVTLPPLPRAGSSDGCPGRDLLAAIGALAAEVLAVRAGRATALDALDGEIGRTRRLLAALGGPPNRHGVRRRSAVTRPAGRRPRTRPSR